MARQGFTESPKGLLVGRLVGVAQAEKGFEAQTAGDLKLELLIAQLEKVLNDESLEHHEWTKSGPSAQPPGLRLGKAFEDRRKKGPVDDFIQPGQRVAHLMQFLQAGSLVEEAAFIGFNILGHRVCILERVRKVPCI